MGWESCLYELITSRSGVDLITLNLAENALPKLVFELACKPAKANKGGLPKLHSRRNGSNSNAKQDSPSADTRALIMLNVIMVTGRTLVLQTFQNALFLYELFASSADVIEWLIMSPL